MVILTVVLVWKIGSEIFWSHVWGLKWKHFLLPNLLWTNKITSMHWCLYNGMKNASIGACMRKLWVSQVDHHGMNGCHVNPLTCTDGVSHVWDFKNSWGSQILPLDGYRAMLNVEPLRGVRVTFYVIIFCSIVE